MFELWKNANGRNRARAWAESNGWRYAEIGPSLVSRWSGGPFGEGRSRTAKDVITGRHNGRTALAFTYRWTTEDGGNGAPGMNGMGPARSSSTHVCEVVALALPAALPFVEFRRGGLAHMIASALGWSALTFGSKEFDRAWKVRTEDEEFARQIVTPAMQDWLMSRDNGGGLILCGNDVVTWKQGRLDPDSVPGTLKRLDAFARHIPDEVWRIRGVVGGLVQDAPVDEASAQPGPDGAGGADDMPAWGTAPQK